MVISVAVVVGSLRHDLIVIPVKDQCLYVEGFQILGEVSFRESLDAEIGSRHSSKVARFVCVVTLTMGKRFTGTDASASLRGLDVAGGDLAFVGGEGGQDFGLLTLRDLEEIQGPAELGCDLIKFCRGDPEFPVGLFKAKPRRAG